MKQLLKVAFLSVLIVAVSAATVSASENLVVHFLDVGQGDSELLQFNGKNVLIDGGSRELGPSVESYLRNHGVSSLDLVIATHPHEDHIGGLIFILNDIPVKQVLDSGQVHTAPSFETYLDLIDKKNIPFDTAQRSQTINLDPNLKIEVLSPPKSQYQDDINENSIVLKVTYKKVSFLFMGDAGLEAENSIMTTGYNLKSDILKVGHHGSSSASGSSFLAKVKPSISMIEVGAGNDYGHPTQKTLSALQNTGSKIYRTDTNGNIVVTTDGLSYSVSAEKLSRSAACVMSLTAALPSIRTSIEYGAAITTTNTIATSSQQSFVGSVKSNKYHYPSCQWGQKIKPSNEIWFTSSEDARAHGYVPCKVCNPP